MISKGTVSAEELRRQLGNAIPGAVPIMARALGVGTAQLNEMMKQGELISTDVLPKFAAQLQKEFGPGVERATKTAASSFARLGNEIRGISVTIGENILKGLQPAADFLTRLLAQARTAREQAERELGRTAAETIAGKPIAGFQGVGIELPSGATDEELRKVRELTERVASLNRIIADPNMAEGAKARAKAVVGSFEEQIRIINEVIQTRNKLGDIDEFEAKGKAGDAIKTAQEAQKKRVEEILSLWKQLP
jgi:tape measure domain-containing protein